MAIFNFLTFASICLGVAAAPSGGSGKVEACSATSQLPCKCPSGTQYSESFTTSIIGAPACDVAAVVNDFYASGWLGAVPFKTSGPDNTPGRSVRTTHFPTPIGVYDVAERLIERRVSPDGSFIQRFQQDNVPVEYKSGNGSFSGYWVTLEGRHIFQNETLMVWSIYACETGHARNFAVFHQDALQNVTEILTNSSKIVGVNAKPESAQTFGTY